MEYHRPRKWILYCSSQTFALPLVTLPLANYLDVVKVRGSPEQPKPHTFACQSLFGEQPHHQIDAETCHGFKLLPSLEIQNTRK